LSECNHTIQNDQLKSYIQENELLNLLMENPYEGFVYVDERGIIQYVNDSFAYYTKLPKDRLIGHNVTEFRFDLELERVMKTQKYELLSFLHTCNRQFIVSKKPVFRNGSFVGICARVIDVEEHFYGLLTQLEAVQILFGINQTLLELNSYKDEFNKTHSIELGIDNIIGTSPAIEELKKKVLVVSNSPSSVLLTGESGTGKELFAKAIHFQGARSSYPFIKVNCAAIPENLLEAELFGYVNGAFTGARKGGKMGKFELADKGTIFLDEIGDMPMPMQAKLLRVLQEREVERIGGERSIPVNIRIVSASNKDLHSLVREGAFREDLYYRLNVINFHIPPLRERMNDIPHIVDYAINRFNEKLGRNVTGISPSSMELLLNYDWPGNIRELINVIEASMNFCRSTVITQQDLPYFFECNEIKKSVVDTNDNLHAKIENIEKMQLLTALKKSNGKRKHAAVLLGVSKTTLFRLMKKHNLL